MSSYTWKYIYGPVYSWRLGMSLGIDPVSTQHKSCNFDCSYCQLGPTRQFVDQRQNFVAVDDVVDELKQIPSDVNIDYYTFSSRGEPTLAKNLGAMIDAVKKVCHGRVAVITNASLMFRPDVREDLLKADYVLAKLDAPSQDIFEKINCPNVTMDYEQILQGIRMFAGEFSGRLGLQMMFVEKNKKYASQMAELAREIVPDEVQINTPLRPSQEKPLSEEELREVSRVFEGLPVTMVYDAQKKDFQPLNIEATKLRHGEFGLK